MRLVTKVCIVKTMQVSTFTRIENIASDRKRRATVCLSASDTAIKETEQY